MTQPPEWYGQALWRILALIAVFLSMAGVAAAQALVCLPREAMVRALAERFDEHQIGRGLSDTSLMELFAGEDGDWSILVTHASGNSCLVAIGTHFESIEPETLGDDG